MTACPGSDQNSPSDETTLTRTPNHPEIIIRTTRRVGTHLGPTVYRAWWTITVLIPRPTTTSTRGQSFGIRFGKVGWTKGYLTIQDFSLLWPRFARRGQNRT